MVVLAQLSPKHGFQIKWALEFPGAPLGAIEYILTHVSKKLGDAGVKTATFGAGATGTLQAVDNVHGFRVKTLEKAYNGLSSTFNLAGKGDFRSKFGTWHDPVRSLDFTPTLSPCGGARGGETRRDEGADGYPRSCTSAIRRAVWA